MLTWHRCGISVPSRLATSQIVSPSAATTGLPSRVNSTVPAISELLTEVRQQMVDRVWRGLAEAADGRIAHHGFEVAQRGLVERAVLLQQRHHLAGALAARRALAATLMLEEFQQVQRRRLGAVVIGKDNNGVRADKRALLGQFSTK